MKPEHGYTWKVIINDGFCEYEFVFEATNGCVSIDDIVKIIGKKLKAAEPTKRMIK